ncbi:hypothetical protein GGI35DRAFT_464562 [Trichoderma velutinum]
MKGRKAGAVALCASGDIGIGITVAAAGVCALMVVIVAVGLAFQVASIIVLILVLPVVLHIVRMRFFRFRCQVPVDKVAASDPHSLLTPAHHRVQSR